MNHSDNRPPTLSLIVATVDRVNELIRLLSSIDALPLVEVVIVDQNEDDRVAHVLERCAAGLRYQHVRSARGLSRARNAGLAVARGSVVGFPDDDCWYPQGFLYQVVEWFDREPGYDLLCGSIKDDVGNPVASRWPRRSQPLDRGSVLRAAVSASLFVRSAAARRAGGFDEQIGLGAATPYQSGEDTDFALRCLAAGSRLWFEEAIWVLHPSRNPAQMNGRRALNYGMGFGFLLAKHSYPQRLLLYHAARAMMGSIRAMLLLRGKEAAFYLQSARGRWQGYRSGIKGNLAGRFNSGSAKPFG